MNRFRAFELSVPPTAVDHAIGPADAAVTVVEYGDFECPNCKQAAPVVKLLLGRFADRVRFVYRHFPLEEVHPHALRAAEAAECCRRAGQVLADARSAVRQPAAPEASGAPRLRRAAAARHDALHLDMDDHVYLQRIREHMQSGRDSGVRATPTFFVDGKIQDVSFGMRALFDAVEAALRRRRTP